MLSIHGFSNADDGAGLLGAEPVLWQEYSWPYNEYEGGHHFTALLCFPEPKQSYSIIQFFLQVSVSNTHAKF